jgi:hypothetical protein
MFYIYIIHDQLPYATAITLVKVCLLMCRIHYVSPSSVPSACICPKAGTHANVFSDFFLLNTNLLNQILELSSANKH